MERPNAIPTSPGVYLYKDKGGRIIYVGKARNLKKRVLSYFRPDEQLTAKTRAMMSHAVSVEFLTTSTEKEALLLEASLIKKHRPHYNIVLRDDNQNCGKKRLSAFGGGAEGEKGRCALFRTVHFFAGCAGNVESPPFCFSFAPL